MAKVYWTAVPRSQLERGIELLLESGESNFFGVDRAEDLPFVVPDEAVTTAVDGGAHLAAKLAAMRAHASQIAADGPFFALAEKVGEQAFGTEYYRLVRGRPGPADGPDGRETDLFAGLV